MDASLAYKRRVRESFWIVDMMNEMYGLLKGIATKKRLGVRFKNGLAKMLIIVKFIRYGFNYLGKIDLVVNALIEMVE